MSTILRTLRNIRRIGIKDYLHQMQYIGDTKAGTLIASDRYGNKYYENVDDELPLRTRWVDYKEKEYSPYAPPSLPSPFPFLSLNNKQQSQPDYAYTRILLTGMNDI